MSLSITYSLFTITSYLNFIFLLSSVGSGSDTLYTIELWGETNKKDTDFRSESSYSSLAQSVERMTVNHDVGCLR